MRFENGELIINSFYMDYQKNQKRILADEVYQWMKKRSEVWVLVGDLGYKMWDEVRADFPERFINCGASEQAMIGLAVGLAISGKIPIVYSITPFLLYRPFETIRNYINNEKIPVKLVGSGRGFDYKSEGFSHWAPEDRKILKIFKNIHAVWPKTYKEIPEIVAKMINDKKPWYVNLKKK